MTKKILIVFHCIFFLLLLQCGTFKDSSRYIDSYCLDIKLRSESTVVKWKENMKLQATFYNSCSSLVKIQNSLYIPYDGIVLVKDSSGNELEQNWVNSWKKDGPYSILLPNDSLSVSILFPIMTWYSLPKYGTYYLQLKYYGHLPDDFGTVGNKIDSSVYSNTIKIEYVK